MKLKSLALIALSVLAILSFTLLSSATAEETDYSDVNLRIISKNLAYKDSVHLLVACDNDGVESNKIELVMWNHKPSSPAETPTFVDEVAVPYYGDTGEVLFETVFESYGISAKDMPDYIYMASHIKGTDVYSAIYRYSALEYLYERISIGNPTDEQLAFYESALAYAENAQIVLRHDVDNSPNDINYVAVKGGTISDGYTAGTYSSGSEITISANSPDTFSMWTNAAGEIVSYEQTFTTTADERTSLFIAVSGYTVTVSVNGETTTTSHAHGDIATISAPMYTVTENGKEYFVGWTSSKGETVSNVATAKITITSSETYIANYRPVSEIAGSTLLDYTDSALPIVALSPNSTVETVSDYTQLNRRNKIDGRALLIESTRDAESPRDYVNTFFDASSTASSALFSLDLLLATQRDIDGSGSIDRADYTKISDYDTLYTFIYTIGSFSYSLKLDMNFEDDMPVGIKIVSENGNVLGTVGFDATSNISLEVSGYKDKTLVSVYLDGKAIDSVVLDAVYAASAHASLSVCTDMGTNGRLYIDNTLFYTAE